MYKSIKIALSGLFLCLTLQNAMAEGNAYYATIDAGRGRIPDSCVGAQSLITSSTITAGSCNSDGASTGVFRLGSGYQISPNLSIEANYVDVGKVTVALPGYTSTTTITASVTTAISGYQIAGLASTSIGNGFELFAKLGIATMTVDTYLSLSALAGNATATSANYTFSNTGATMGTGVRYKVNDQLSIRMMYEDLGSIKYASNGIPLKVSVLTAGLQFGF